MRTLSANEKLVKKLPHLNVMVIIIAYAIRLLLFFDFNLPNKLNKRGAYVSHIYEYSSSTLTIFLMVYLLLTIIRVVKLVKFEKGPLVARL